LSCAATGAAASIAVATKPSNGINAARALGRRMVDLLRFMDSTPAPHSAADPGFAIDGAARRAPRAQPIRRSPIELI
jgi:hypothetical protein